MKCGHCRSTGPEITVAHVRNCASVLASYSTYELERDETTAHEKFMQAEKRFDSADDAWQAAQRREWVASNNQTRGINSPRGTSPDWELVNNLRREVANHLHRVEGAKRIGYFAVRLDGSDAVKFYRVKKMISGKWIGKTFVDAQASDDWYPVRAPQTLTMVLRAISVDPVAAGKLYADELGQCCRCNKTLTDEESRARGIGPICYGKDAA